MVKSNLTSHLARLSAAERILLAQDLWDSVADDPEAAELSPEQERELNRRMKAYLARRKRGEKTGTPWAQVKRRLRRAI